MKRSKIKALVDSILGDDYAIPIDLNAIANKIDAKIIENDLNDASLSGFAFHKNGSRIIGVNSSEHEHRRRFTIAHELGHLFLHSNNAVNYDKGGVMMFRDNHASDGTDIKEIEANRFAAELLMPEASIKEYMAQAGAFDLMNDEDGLLKELADRFNVSLQAMAIRLSTLYFN